MPTSRESRAQRLMFKSMDSLQMPKFEPLTVEPHSKDNDLYTLKWPSYGNTDVQNRINNVLGPLSLFAPFPHEDEPEPENIELERPVTPINEEIKAQPTTFDKLAFYVRRRIAVQDDVPYLSKEDQQSLAGIIMGELNHIWPEVRRQIDDPFLSPKENKELNRRISVHIVTVCEKLFNHYLHKAQILNERGVFSGPANMSRLRAQLALDADKFLNILTIRRYLVADMRGKESKHPELNRLLDTKPAQNPDQRRNVQLTFTDMIQSSQPKLQKNLQSVNGMEQDLKEIVEAMPYLDTSKLLELLAGLPERGMQTPSERIPEMSEAHSHSTPDPSWDTHHASDHSSPSPSLEGQPRLSEDNRQLASHSKVLLKRVKSDPVLHAGETLLEELGIPPAVRSDLLLDTELSVLQHERLHLAKKKNSMGVKVKIGAPGFAAEDLRQLLEDKDVQEPLDSEEEDLPPLLQAITRNARHDNLQQRLEEKLKELEERARQRKQDETIDVHAPTHPQPATVSTKVNGKMVVRTSDIRVSERVCLSSITLNCYATVYNDLIEEIDPVTVKNLDKNLFLSDEITEVYREIMKTVTSDHLNLDHDETVVPAPESVNIAGTLASATLSKIRRHRVINPSLHHDKPPPWGQQDMKTWARTPTNPPKNFQGEDIFTPLTPNLDKIHEAMHNPTRMMQLMTLPSGLPTVVADNISRTYASWLQWWKSTVTSDDYMKYLSTLETDYMGAVFHFYDSEEEDESDEEDLSKHGPLSRQTLSSKLTQEQRERDMKLEELRALKTEYKAGLWNANSVLMGGLGKDPPLHDDLEVSSQSIKSQDSRHASAKTLQEKTALVRQSGQSPASNVSHMSKTTIASEAVHCGGGESWKSIRQPQERLENVWNSLQMPDGQRLDMAIKYSCGQYFSRLTEAVERWEQVTELILQREVLLDKLEKFERTASDPNRFFERDKGIKKSSVLLLEESRYRSYLCKKIDKLDTEIKEELAAIKHKFQDIVSFRGRPYEDKMKWDKVEMLHWLQEERKQNALRFESLMRNIPLKSAQLQPIPAIAATKRALLQS